MKPIWATHPDPKGRSFTLISTPLNTCSKARQVASQSVMG